MNNRRYIVAMITLSWFAGTVLGQSLTASDGVRGICASTPATALLAAKSAGGISTRGLAEARGYRVESVRWDPLQRQSWAVIASCDHHEQPSVTMLMNPTAPSRAFATATVRVFDAMPIVRAGDLVRLWKSDRYARIEMVATSEENGAVGTRVRVRIAAPGMGDGQGTQPQYLAGVVRGPADVEMEP